MKLTADVGSRGQLLEKYFKRLKKLRDQQIVTNDEFENDA